MGIKVSNACLIFRDKDNNVAYIKSLSDEDLSKIKEAVIDTKSNKDKIEGLDDRVTELEGERVGAVLYDRTQSLTSFQKLVARNNIDAASGTLFRQHTTDPSAHVELFDQKVDNSHLTDPDAHSEVFDLYLPLAGGTTTGKVNLTSGSYANLPQVKRTDSTSFTGVRFENTNGLLGSVGMSGTVNGPLLRADSSGNTYTVIDSSNYNNYTPTKTGGGASGTWGINISGNANTSTTLATARTINVQDATGTHTGTGASFNGSGNAMIRLPATISADITGNAATATKATQDGSGQQINTTYIKSISTSNGTLTYTKGNGTTGSVVITDSSKFGAPNYNDVSGGDLAEGDKYTAPSNGIIYVGAKPLPGVTSSANVSINGYIISTVTVNRSQPFLLKSGDTLTCDQPYSYSFIPCV